MKNFWRKKLFVLFLMVSVMITDQSFSMVNAKTTEKRMDINGIQGREVSVSATNSFGKLLQEPVSEQAEEQEDNNGYNVFSVEMQDKAATVSMETVEDCTLVVGIYEEDGIKMLATGEKVVTREEREVTLDIGIDAMPQYYLVRAFLMETDTLNPLCSVYETPMYTKEMQDFLSKTTDDFEEDRVLNLDEDKTNNFAVYDEDTKIIRGDDNSNHLKCTNEKKQEYIIENADTSALSLSKGDIFAYERENEEVVIVKVQSVSATGSTVRINGADTELEDVFEYVKIDETATTEDMEVDSSTCSEEVEYQGKENNSAGRRGAISGEGSTSVSLSYRFVDKKFPTKSPMNTDNVKIKISGEVKLSIKTTLKVYLSLQYQYLEFTSKYSLANDWAGEIKATIKIKLGEVDINPVPGLFIRLTPSLLLEGKTSVGIVGTIDGCVGYSASPQDGFKNLTSAPSLNEEKTELKIEGSVFIGLSLEPKVTVVTEKLVKAEAGMKAGLELEISNDYLETLDDAKEKHDCSNCFEGEIHVKGEISASLKFFDDESFEVKGKKEKKFKICDIYLCIQHGKFAFSACPYHQYKVTVIAKNPDGTLVKDATVNGGFQTNSNGEAYLWFASGKHKLSVSKNGEDVITKVVDVAGKARKITVKFKTNSVVDDGTGDSGNIGLESNPLAGKKIKGMTVSDDWCSFGAITENGDLYMWGDNTYGQIGDGTIDRFKPNPVKVLSNVQKIESCFGRSGAITENGDLYMWGDDAYGQVGNGTTKDQTKPVKVLSNVKEIVLSGNSSGAITESGDLYMWGDGPVGDGTKEKQTKPIKILSGVKSLALKCGTGGAITENGDLYMWGYNGEYGKVGDGTHGGMFISSEYEYKILPVKVLSEVSKLALGRNNSGAITENGDLYMWGDNAYGQIGDGTTVDRYKPVKILSDINEIVLDIHNSGGDTCGAISKDGGLYMWGANSYSKIGDGTEENKTKPVEVLLEVKEISIGERVCGAVTESGNLYMWGDDYGIGGIQSTPLQINAPLSTAKKLSKSNKKLATQAITFPQIYTWTGRATGWGGPGSYPASANHEQGTSEVTYDPANTNIKGSVGYGCGLELMNLYNDDFTGEENELAQILKTMKKTCIRVTLENSGVAHGWNWDKQLEFPSGKNVLFPEGYLDTQYLAIFGDDDTLTNVQIYDASLFTLASDGSISSVQSFEDLDRNARYNYYLLKSKDTEDILSGDNLLYIGQGVTDSSGTLYAAYKMKEDCEKPVILLKKLEKDDISNAKIMISDLRYNKQEQYINPTVSFRGKNLIEGEDYELSGDFSANKIGGYTVTICGIGNYTGFVDKTYDVNCSHQFGDWIISKRPTVNSTGIQKRICSLCEYEEEKSIAKLQSTPSPTETDNIGNGGTISATNSNNEQTINKNTESDNSSKLKKKIKKPGKVTGLDLSLEGRKLLISWNWKSNVSGFQIQYALNKKFTKKKKTKNVGKYAQDKTIRGLKKKKTYYVRVRAYKKVSGKKIYGKWSKIKKIKIK